jgi:hypothetical protein
VTAFGVGGLNVTKTVTVPDLGDVTVACDTDGAATGGFRTPNLAQFREDYIDAQGGVGVHFGITFTKSYTERVFGNNVTLMLYKPGIGMWKLEFHSLVGG